VPEKVELKLTRAVVFEYTRRMDDQYRTHNIRFRVGQLAEIRDVADRAGLSLQDIVRLSVNIGLAQVASTLTRPTMAPRAEEEVAQ
jgi:hypothetical protein